MSIEQPLPSQTRRSDLSSWGIGLRFRAFDRLQGAFDWAYPRQSTTNVEAGDSRVHLQLSYGF